MLQRRTSDSDNSFLARQIRDMDKGIIEGSEDVSNSKDKFSFPDLRTEAHDLFFGSDLLLWRLTVSLASGRVGGAGRKVQAKDRGGVKSREERTMSMGLSDGDVEVRW